MIMNKREEYKRGKIKKFVKKEYEKDENGSKNKERKK